MLLLQFVAHCLHILNRCDLSFTFHVIFNSFFFSCLNTTQSTFYRCQGQPFCWRYRRKFDWQHTTCHHLTVISLCQWRWQSLSTSTDLIPIPQFAKCFFESTGYLLTYSLLQVGCRYCSLCDSDTWSCYSVVVTLWQCEKLLNHP